MKVIYSSTLCSKKKYEKLYNSAKLLPGQQSQKYHGLLVEGFERNNVEVETVTSIPMSKKISDKLFFAEKKETIGLTTFNYIPIINNVLLKNVSVFFLSFIKTYILLRKNRKSVLVSDILNLSVSSSSLLAAKLLKRKSVGIVTDVPGYLADNSKGKKSVLKKMFSWIRKKINIAFMHHFDSYIYLTEQTNDLINIKNKPYTIIEGLVDINMQTTRNNFSNKYLKKVVMYTGSLKRIYGIKNLVDGFNKANIQGSELHIYGSGNYEDELRKFCKNKEEIKYFGTAPNAEIVKEQLKAILLINPRPTNEEYTKYSFPSKNMEYMVSGTSTLTSRLPGMPIVYNNYVYLLDEVTPNGIAEKLEEILSQPREQIHKHGMIAKDFVLENKNNEIQAKKVISMIYALINV